MANVRIIVSLYETKFHFFDPSNQWLYSPSAELCTVVSDLTSQTQGCLLVQIFCPILLLRIPFWQYKKISEFSSSFIIGMLLASNTNCKFFRQLPDLVNITNFSNYLLFVFDKRIILFKFLRILALYCIYIFAAHSSSFFHKRSNSINTIFIKRLRVLSTCFRDGFPI